MVFPWVKNKFIEVKQASIFQVIFALHMHCYLKMQKNPLRIYNEVSKLKDKNLNLGVFIPSND